jgi:hypothetical protein
MLTALSQALRSRWFVVGAHAVFWVLLYFALTGVGGKSPDFREAQAFSTPSQSPAPIAKLDKLFAAGVWPKALGDTNSLNPFFTRHFIPPQTPAPPPPTTRKIEVTYQGYFQTGDGPRQAMVKLGDAFLVASVGAKLTANVFAAEATMQTLTLTNLTAQTNIIQLNTKKEIEVPIP